MSERLHAPYRGRFAPSPTGRLHRGSLVAALGSWLDARAHEGVWLVRIEDVDPPRDIPGAAEDILRVLGRIGLFSDEPVVWQSTRDELYEATLTTLREKGLLYGCACTRKEILERDRVLGLPPGVYPGTCRAGTGGRPVRMLRFRLPDRTLGFTDRWMGYFEQNLPREAGDVVMKRADSLWAYQLACIADDIAAGVTDVVRGADLLDNTPRQIALIEALGAPVPRYLHLPLVLNDRGEKLSKQQGATPIDEENLLGEIEIAWRHLGFEPLGADNIAAFLREAIPLWRERFVM